MKKLSNLLKHYVTGAIERGESDPIIGTPTKWYGIYFCDPIAQKRTACLILNTSENDPDKMTVSDYSRLFPYGEASKMKRMIMTHYFDSFDATFEHLQTLLKTDAIWSGK